MIGVFDSGDGGLTVLKALIGRLPNQDFLYLGDQAHAPYGERAPEEVYELTLASVDFLFSQGCRLVLLACNTASAVALRRLQQNWLQDRDAQLGDPGRRVLGVLVPMVEAVAGVPWNSETQALQEESPAAGDCVAIFATRRTVETGAFALEIGLRAPQIEVVEQACPELAARIEAAAPASELDRMVKGYVEALMGRLAGRAPDKAVLGCTHYPLVASAFKAALPATVEVLDQPALVAESLADYIERHPAFARASSQSTTPQRFLTTGDADHAAAKASLFFGRNVSFEGCRF